MNRALIARTSLLAGVVITATTFAASAQPAPPPPAPPAPPAAKPPKPPKPPTAGKPSGIDRAVKDEMKRALAEAIDEIEREDDLPPAIKQRILKSMRKAQASGNPGDLIDLTGLGDDLGDDIRAEIERALKEAQRHGKVKIGRGGVRIDLGDDDDDRWSWSWDDDASPFDDDTMDWLRGVPFSPFGSDDDVVPPVPPVPPVPDFDDDDFDFDFDFDIDDVPLDPAKTAALEKIAEDEDKITRPAQRRVEELGKQLRTVVSGADPNQAEIDRLVDAITAEEAKIRKARLGALTKTRKVIGK